MQRREKRFFSLLILVAISAISVPYCVHAQQLNSEIPLAEVQTNQDNLEIKIGTSVYQIEGPKPAEQQRALYDSISEQEQQQFNINRRMFLSMVARALNLMKYGFGIGSIVKNKISFFGEQTKEKQKYMGLSFKEKSQKIILGFLQSIDQSLWKQAPLFARSNEFALFAAGGMELIGGKSSKGWGGLLDLGVSIGYNRDERSLVIQIISDYEKYESSILPAIFLVGAVGKFGIYIANQRTGELRHEGISYYPPAAPAYSSMTKDNFSMGLSSGLTLPPSPLGDLLTYTNRLDQNALLRFTISPLNRGFVRLQTGLGSNTIKAIVSTVKEATQKLIPNFAPVRCSTLFFNAVQLRD